MPTLRQFATRGGDVRSTAHELRIHRNALRYRLKRIAQIAGLFPA
ncbi:MAG: helix-turn-helix domain-containing protein [Chloroflexi bacterium]|nr:helix-turn-helix domain-containing protein [Chloroflexota bacterium]